MLKLTDLFKVEDNVEFRINGWSGKYKIENNKLLYKEVGDNWKESCSQINYLSNAEIEILPQSILTDEEKEYLKAVIKPFKDRKMTVTKKANSGSKMEYLDIDFNNGDYMLFPYFPKGKYYKGMELYKPYTLADLLEE